MVFIYHMSSLTKEMTFVFSFIIFTFEWHIVYNSDITFKYLMYILSKTKELIA